MVELLGLAQVRELVAELGISPTKTLGQNFVHDAGTVRKIVRDAKLGAGDRILEIGPGLGSLTLAILESGGYLSAVEIDSVLASALDSTIHRFAPEVENRFAVLHADALAVTGPTMLAMPPELATSSSAPYTPTHLVANLPYNVAVPILLTLLTNLPSLRSVTAMVQLEVAERLAAEPGSKVYGVPSVKARWYADVWRGAKISRNIFWPVPNVDSALVHFARHAEPDANRETTFDVIDAAFSQRRKTLRSALSGWAGSPARADEILRYAGIDPALRGEKLGIDDFVAIAKSSDILIPRDA